MDEILLVGGDSPKREMIVCLYLKQAIFSLLRPRLFSGAGLFVFPFYFSFDQALIQWSQL